MSIQTPDSGKLEKAMDNAIQMFVAFASKAMVQSLLAIEEAISPYPAQPNRMRSGRLNTYVRGQGSYPRSAFVADKSEPGGFKTKRVSRAVIRFTSQQLDKRYRIMVTPSKNEILGKLWNDASYSGYVIGSKVEEPKQVSFHAETGWPNKEDSLEQAKPMINGFVEQAIDDFMAVLKGGA
jgi:hypothetical protein